MIPTLQFLRSHDPHFSRAFESKKTRIAIGTTHICNLVAMGGAVNTPVIMAGPCAVERYEQLMTTAQAVKKAGAHVLHGGAFKPRTSPYQFQGMGIADLDEVSEDIWR